MTTSSAKVVQIRSPVHIYGFIPVMEDKDGNEEEDGKYYSSASVRHREVSRALIHLFFFPAVLCLYIGGACAISCSLKKPSKESLEMQAEDVYRSTQLCKYLSKYVDWELLFNDIEKYWEVTPNDQ